MSECDKVAMLLLSASGAVHFIRKPSLHFVLRKMGFMLDMCYVMRVTRQIEKWLRSRVSIALPVFDVLGA